MLALFSMAFAGSLLCSSSAWGWELRAKVEDATGRVLTGSQVNVSVSFGSKAYLATAWSGSAVEIYSLRDLPRSDDGCTLKVTGPLSCSQNAFVNLTKCGGAGNERLTVDWKFRPDGADVTISNGAETRQLRATATPKAETPMVGTVVCPNPADKNKTAPLKGARIEVLDENGRTFVSATTGKDGQYRFALPPCSNERHFKMLLIPGGDYQGGVVDGAYGNAAWYVRRGATPRLSTMSVERVFVVPVKPLPLFGTGSAR